MTEYVGLEFTGSATNVSDLIGALSIEGWDGVQVPLMMDTYRNVQKVEGFRGLKTRSSVRPAVGRDGTIVASRYRDDRVMTITGLVFDQTTNDPARMWEEWDKVAAAFAAAVKTDRVIKWRAGDQYLQANVRLEELTDPVEYGPKLLRYQATLRNASGIAFSQTLEVASASGAGTVGGTGLLSPFTSPFTTTPASGGVVVVVNEGGVSTPPLIVLTGYQLNPTVECGDSRIVIDGAVASGDELWLNAADRSVLLNGDPTYDRASMRRSSVSRWFDLPPQTSTVITLSTSDFDSNARIEVRYRPGH